MGIDCYLEWKDKTENDRYCQIHLGKGEYGYLRESYHGEPYATPVLFKEGFEDGNHGQCKIDSEELQGRLPEALKLTAERHFRIYEHEGPESLKESLQHLTLSRNSRN